MMSKSHRTHRMITRSLRVPQVQNEIGPSHSTHRRHPPLSTRPLPQGLRRYRRLCCWRARDGSTWRDETVARRQDGRSSPQPHGQVFLVLRRAGEGASPVGSRLGGSRPFDGRWRAEQGQIYPGPVRRGQVMGACSLEAFDYPSCATCLPGGVAPGRDGRRARLCSCAALPRHHLVLSRPPPLRQRRHGERNGA